MNYTNLNIVSENKIFKYIVEYFDNENAESTEIKYLKNEFGIFLFTDNTNNIIYEKNYFDEITNDELSISSLIPMNYDESSFDLYFPRYSIETYQRNISYILTINTWINGVCVFLASKLINRNDAIAPQFGVRRFLNDEYYEYIRVSVADPFNLIYGEEWKKFRTEMCGEEDIDGYQKNNTGSNINITLTPVKNINGTWVKLDGYDSSQSAIQLIDKNDSNYLSAVLKLNNENGNPEFDCKLRFNEEYKGNLTDYLDETYQIQTDENFKIKYCFLIGDKENPYKYTEKTFTNAVTQSSFYLEDFVFESWDDYFEGLYAKVIVVIQRFDEDILVLSSNKVFITQEEFKYFLPQPIRNIDLQNINMELKNYNVVNVIENKIVTVERPNDYKSNIVKPIFIKVQDSDTIRLHNSVTENICINLDAYKNKVDAFILKIGDMNFYEIGRVNNGIIFKVVGTNLPEQNEGIYYILNEDGELVTNGKYVIV
jgi:hypothetical protein